MNKQIKARWIKALRSGKYKQGVGVLRTEDNKYCCLGVLCDLHSKSTGTKWKKTIDSDFPWEYLDTDIDLPLEVREWANLPINPDNNMAAQLSAYNDGAGNVSRKTFVGIAKLIEKHL